MATNAPSAIKNGGPSNGLTTPRQTTRPAAVPDLLPTPGEPQPEMSPTSKEFKESFAARRESSQLLSPLRMRQLPRGVDAVDGIESRTEVEEEGVVLFNCFLEGQLERSGIQETATIGMAVTSATVQSREEQPAVNVSSFQFDQRLTSDSLTGNGSMSPSLHQYSNPKWAKNGRDLRKLADQFANSRERQGVREKARETVGDEEISAPMFWDMLSELFFQGRVTRERIVVLFFFCSDVAILALQRNTVEYFHRFMVWALQFIRRKVCTWVADNGGWDEVLYASANQLVLVAKVVLVAAVAYGVYKMGKSAYASITRR